MRRVLLVLTVALVMAAMVVATAMPAVAKQSGKTDGGPPVHNYGGAGQSASVFHCKQDPLATYGAKGVYVSSYGNSGSHCH